MNTLLRKNSNITGLLIGKVNKLATLTATTGTVHNTAQNTLQILEEMLRNQYTHNEKITPSKPETSANRNMFFANHNSKPTTNVIRMAIKQRDAF